MFNNQRYMTRGVTGLNSILTVIPWVLIDTMEVESKDYLQIFNCKADVIDGVSMQTIEHKQEQPAYSCKHSYPCECPVNTKLFCIDSQTHSTLLLADEY